MNCWFKREKKKKNINTLDFLVKYILFASYQERNV